MCADSAKNATSKMVKLSGFSFRRRPVVARDEKIMMDTSVRLENSLCDFERLTGDDL